LEGGMERPQTAEEVNILDGHVVSSTLNS
jgi:hypothetical protein